MKEGPLVLLLEKEATIVTHHGQVLQSLPPSQPSELNLKLLFEEYKC